MTLIKSSENWWSHPSFEIFVSKEGMISLETDTMHTVQRFSIGTARDLVQALTQAIAAAEVASVERDE